MKQQYLTKGFTFIEVLAVLSIIAIATLGTLVLRDWAVSNARVSEAKSMITTLQSGAQMWRPNTGIYTGISITELTTIGAVPETWGDGVEKNPWGGDVSVAPDVGDLTRYTVTLSGVSSSTEGERLVREYSNTAVVASYTSESLTITFQG
ncbi:type II secretion system protein [Idiomarina seosinensis]|uniref:Prepilin-type cleavage/methylation domain-containing protein n=1 Tax=Idiomarina seosinensis TaxID=281739 RepID=A0A432ZGN6_9GAMM|nr:prepilin-type N-terminal cleavage/methylation domain-containing protein [Idiomarina seosinensis]RUO77167.1 prepilin-type cleavage/methylation domain-containing protein [Idiomarina seosinensis]